MEWEDGGKEGRERGGKAQPARRVKGNAEGRTGRRTSLWCGMKVRHTGLGATATHQWPGSSPRDGCVPTSPPRFSAGVWLGSKPQLDSKQSAPGTASADFPAGQTPGPCQWWWGQPAAPSPGGQKAGVSPRLMRLALERLRSSEVLSKSCPSASHRHPWNKGERQLALGLLGGHMGLNLSLSFFSNCCIKGTLGREQPVTFKDLTVLPPRPLGVCGEGLKGRGQLKPNSTARQQS